MLYVKPCAEMLADNRELTLLQNCHNKETFTSSYLGGMLNMQTFLLFLQFSK